MRFALLAVGLLTLAFSSPVARAGEFTLNLETGAVWQDRNDVRIPPDGGSYFEFDRFNKGPFFHYRGEASYQFHARHRVRALLAPFKISVHGKSAQNIDYNGSTFQADQDLTVNYRFNSYRLTYAYRAWLAGGSYLDVGLTGKIRDANIELRQGAITSQNYKNVGFVPLIFLEYNQELSQRLSFNFQTDAAAASQGRAIDASLKLRYALNDHTQVGLGYRTLEGGADNKKVFTFSWFNYAVADIGYTF